MSDRSRSTLIVCVLLAVVILHLAVAWQDMSVLARNGYLYDDSFYAFQIARNIAQGNGMTFDGIHPTTGFQPLYVFLLVPLFMISSGDPALPIHLALSMLALFTAGTAFLLFRIARRYTGFAASLAAMVIWAFSPIVIKQAANGLETSIATFMIALSVWYYLERVRGEMEIPAFRYLTLGLLLGLAVVSRIDATLLAMVIVLDYLMVLRRRGARPIELARLLLVPAGVFVLYGPWVIFNLAESGSLIQDSGRATRFLSLAYASYFGYGTESLASSGPDMSFIWTHLEHAVASLKVIPPVQVFFRSTEKIDAFLGSGAAFRIAGNIAGFIVLAAAGIAVFRWRSDAGRKNRGEAAFLLLFAGLLMLSYAIYIFGAFFFLRYFFPVYLVSCLYLAFFLEDIFEWVRSRPAALKRFAYSSAAAYVIVFSSFSYSQAFRSHPVYPYYDIALWIDENTEEGDRIGVFQCGTIGYLCDREIINLDGKVNRDAFFALKGARLCEYLADEGIDMVIDHTKIIELFLGVTHDKMMMDGTKVAVGAMYPRCSWYAIKCALLDRDGGIGALSAPDTTVSPATLIEND